MNAIAEAMSDRKWGLVWDRGRESG